MARKSQGNPQLDMTPMIDVVFELIIFFVVTLNEAENKDESIVLDDGVHGILLDKDELPPEHLQFDVNWKGEITINGRKVTPNDVYTRVKMHHDKLRREFPVMIRADIETPHIAVAAVMDACTRAGIWKLSFMAIKEDKTFERKDKLAKRRKGGR